MFSGSEDRLWLIHLADGAVRRYRRAFLQENRFDCLVGGSYSSRALQRVGFFRGSCSSRPQEAVRPISSAPPAGLLATPKLSSVGGSRRSESAGATVRV